MYNSEEDDSRRGSERYAVPASKTQNIVRAIFGIVMIIIYVGMGVLLLINFSPGTAIGPGQDMSLA